MTIYKGRRTKGLLFVLSGPSGVGKDALLIHFLETCPGVTKCVTATTRDPRPGETAGKDYQFISLDEFKRMIEAGEFLEYAEVHDHLYGTPRKLVEETLESGIDVILKIDVQGGLAVKKLMPEAILVFLAPPSIEELERRLRNRLTESEPEITKRLLDAGSELERIPEYDYLIENGDLADAADRLRCLVMAERSKIER
ncbi:MAG: guanylate kinase [Armatimonadota bacterium]|nr:guanylate kinase [Armatimonadota bacterium]